MNDMRAKGRGEHVIHLLRWRYVTFYHVVFLLKNEWNLSFPHGELEAWVCVAHEALRCMLLGQLLLTQDILILALASSLPPGLSNADDEEDLTLRPECVTQRFLLSTFISWRRAFGCFSLANYLFRWLDTIQNYPPLLCQRIGFGRRGHLC
ncbi:hypothetical protein AAG906_025173 [Vitis piasezkii]